MSFVALVVLKIWKCHNRELKSAQSAATPIILLVAMGISKEFGVATTTQHFQKGTYPLQSGIVWTWKDDVKVKMYLHNIGGIKDKKTAPYTGFGYFKVFLRKM